MKIEGNTVIFKSDPDNYYKEFQGWKPNTVRWFNDENELNQFLEFKKRLNLDSKIKIICVDKEKRYDLFFEKYITDISRIEDIFIISWKH